jgi:hypothetical protein
MVVSLLTWWALAIRGHEDRGRSFVLGPIRKICSELLSLSLDEIRSAASGKRECGRRNLETGNEPRRTRSTESPLLDSWDLS